MEPTYYLSLLKTVLQCLPFKLRYEVIASVPQRANLTTPTGKQWTAPAVASLMCRLRRGTGYVAHALAAGVVSGHFSRTDYAALTGTSR